MKKFLKKLSLFSLLVGGVVSLGVVNAAALPASASQSFSVINVSQGNKPASQVGVRAGDVLRYELNINSTSDDVTEFAPSFQISDILKKMDIVDVGLGQLNGANLVFPPFSQKAPCKKNFSFFVKLKKCNILNGAKSVNVDGFGANLSVPVQCGNTPIRQTQPVKPRLQQTGSSTGLLGAIGLLSLLAVAFLTGSAMRRNS